MRIYNLKNQMYLNRLVDLYTSKTHDRNYTLKQIRMLRWRLMKTPLWRVTDWIPLALDIFKVEKLHADCCQIK